MTGLPSLPEVPPALPLVRPLAAAARTWVEMARAVGSAGAHTPRVLPRPGDWTGPAADSAAARAAQLSRHALEAADTGLAGATAVATWAHAVHHLTADRSRLRARSEAEALSLDNLAGLPDGRPDAPALRAGAWHRHDDLVRGWHDWRLAVRRAEDALVVALLTPPEGTHEQHLDAAYRALLALDDSRAAGAARAALADGGTDAFLLDFDPAAFHGDGSAVIAYGAPSAADHVAVVVPGMTTDAIAIGEVGAMALAVRGAARERAPGERTATVAWVGYDAPADDDLHHGRVDPRDLADTIRVAGPGAAEAGGAALRSFVEETTRHRQDVTVIGHSYGSTTAAQAAADGLDADRLVLLGSPGAVARTAADLRVPTFVGADDLDPVTWIGRPDRHHTGPLGPDPAARGFGATRLPSGPSVPPHLDQPGAFVALHAGYLAPRSGTLAAVASVVTGRSPTTVPARTSTGAGLAADWLLGQTAYELTSWR